jgi:predicted RecA/RadA family phage recombinase
MLDRTSRIIRLHPDDNVVIALTDIPAGVRPEGLDAALVEPAPRGHKIAAVAIARGTNVVRYGQIIGQATADIPAGAHVHTQNLGMGEPMSTVRRSTRRRGRRRSARSSATPGRTGRWGRGTTWACSPR